MRADFVNEVARTLRIERKDLIEKASNQESELPTLTLEDSHAETSGRSPALM